MTRRGRPPAATSAELRSRAIGHLAALAAAGAPAPSGAALGRELGIDRTAGTRLLAELRAAGLATADRVSPAGRTYSAPRTASSVVRLPAATLAQLEALAPGQPIAAQVASAATAARLGAALASPAATSLRGAVLAHADHPSEIRTEALDLARARVVGVDYSADGAPLELHLDVGGTGQRPTWRVVLVFPPAG